MQMPNLLAPIAELPVLEGVSAAQIMADLTLRQKSPPSTGAAGGSARWLRSVSRKRISVIADLGFSRCHERDV
jgi:hypothetical protein